MLIITRKRGQGLTIGNSIRIHVVETSSGSVKLGVDAPPDVSVYRDEIYNQIAARNRAAIQPSAPDEQNGADSDDSDDGRSR